MPRDRSALPIWVAALSGQAHGPAQAGPSLVATVATIGPSLRLCIDVPAGGPRSWEWMSAFTISRTAADLRRTYGNSQDEMRMTGSESFDSVSRCCTIRPDVMNGRLYHPDVPSDSSQASCDARACAAGSFLVLFCAKLPQRQYLSVWPEVIRDGNCPKPIAKIRLGRYKYGSKPSPAKPLAAVRPLQEMTGMLSSEEAVQ